jgi:hypothetical protein
MIVAEGMACVRDAGPVGERADTIGISIELRQHHLHGLDLRLDGRVDDALNACAQILEDALSRIEFRRVGRLLNERATSRVKPASHRSSSAPWTEPDPRRT